MAERLNLITIDSIQDLLCCVRIFGTVNFTG